MSASHRLAMRDEGGTVAFYLAAIDTLEGSTEIMRVDKIVFALVPDARERLLLLMEEFLTNGAETLTGETPTLERRAAPESERGGHA